MAGSGTWSERAERGKRALGTLSSRLRSLPARGAEVEDAVEGLAVGAGGALDGSRQAAKVQLCTSSAVRITKW